MYAQQFTEHSNTMVLLPSFYKCILYSDCLAKYAAAFLRYPTLPVLAQVPHVTLDSHVVPQLVQLCPSPDQMNLMLAPFIKTLRGYI